MLKPDAAAVLLHDSLTERQADAAAWVAITGVKPLKETKDLLSVLRLNSNAIIDHGEYAPSVAFFG